MNYEEIRRLQEFEILKKTVLRKVLTKEARERLGRIKLVKPELAAQIEIYLVQLYQSGQIKGIISDEQLKAILEKLSSKRSFRVIK
ncbi:MAG TPA: hypothetical protein ENG45_01275 [Candidatus Aenigmarchaeota archaeon]|nr:hypothetical protein [Candidatus Aenigmarchaeota archaeon]